MTLRTALAHSLLSLAALALTACGGDDDPGGAPADAGTGADAARPPADAGGQPADTAAPPADTAGPSDDVGPQRPAVPYSGWDPLPYAGGPLGTSVRGRTLAGERFGEGGPLVFLMFTIHGNEAPAEQLGERFRTWLLLHPEATDDVQIVYLTQANPDGYVAGTRRNANDVDLNRNFPASNFDNTGHPEYGPAPASEPETQAIAAIVEDGDPSVIVTTHTPLDVIDFDGPADEYAAAAAAASGYPVDPPDTGTVPAYPGSFGSFAGLDLQIPTITFELEAAIDTLAGHERGERAIAAILALAAEREQATGRAADLVAPGAADDLYAGWTYGQSAGVRPLAIERFGREGRPVLVVAGLDGGPMPVFVAERLRAVLLGRLQTELPPRQVLLVTVANPDGVVAGRAPNNDGVSPDVDFPHPEAPHTAPLATPEAGALAALVAEVAPAAVVVLTEGRLAVAAGDDLRQPLNAFVNRFRVPVEPALLERPGALPAWLGGEGVPALVAAVSATPPRGALERARQAALAVLAAIDTVPEQ
jgi:protein MpaA